LNLPRCATSRFRGLGILSTGIGASGLGLGPKSAFFPTFMYCLPILVGEPSPNKPARNFIFDAVYNRGVPMKMFAHSLDERRGREFVETENIGHDSQRQVCDVSNLDTMTSIDAKPASRYSSAFLTILTFTMFVS
jgi:hypothetical protein